MSEDYLEGLKEITCQKARKQFIISARQKVLKADRSIEPAKMAGVLGRTTISTGPNNRTHGLESK